MSEQLSQTVVNAHNILDQTNCHLEKLPGQDVFAQEF